MTTIAYRDGIMACDSCWSENKAVDTLQTKIQRLKSGALLGSAGDNDNRDIVHALENCKTPASLPTKTTLLSIRCEYSGLLILPRGRVFKVATTHVSEAHWGSDFDDDIGVWEISVPFTAIGTGKEFALGAMAAGKSAREAVAIACRFDLNSRPPLHVLELRSSK